MTSAPAARRTRYLPIVGFAALVLVTALVASYVGLRTELDELTTALLTGTLPQWLVIAIIFFVAAAISSTVGFAFSAIAGAMILHYVADGVEAVQVMMIASIGIQAYSVAGLWRSIEWSRCVPFLLGGAAVMPIGILLLLSLQPRAYVLAMGAALVAYGAYMLLRRPIVLKIGKGRGIDVLIGGLGGLTGPLAAFPGACVTIWCGMRGWDKLTQRAVYQPYILIMQMVALGALCLQREQSSLDPALLAYALPGLAGAVIGLRVFRALNDLQFHRAINVALVASGVALLVK